MTQNASKKPFAATINSNAESRVPFSVAQRECPPSPAKTETEFEAPLPLKRMNWSLHDHRASIAAESGTNTTCTTGTPATRKTRNNCGTTAVFCTLNHGLSLNTKGMSTTLSRLQRWELDCLPQLCTYNTTTTLSMYCNRRNSGTDHRNLPLRHDRGGNNITIGLRTWRCTITGMSTRSKNCKQPRLCMSTGTSTNTSNSQAQRSHGGGHWERRVRELYHHEPSAGSVSNVQVSPMSSSTQVRGP